ncbi:MAG: DegT/DnrJ/EryC1/StrS family aminotransferase [Rhodospirillaceae bacterium]|nr:DegT/DnrJ/EryC1/StrS family aminotransferase [Rhodospirillaceae bacterium]
MTKEEKEIHLASWSEWPHYDEEHAEAVNRVIKSNRLFNGPELEALEEIFSDFTGSDHTVGLGNATQGLHLALAATDIGVDDEVIVTPYSWISSASCVLMQNAIPIFADIEPNTFGLDIKSIKEKVTPKTKAIVLVHMFGYPAEIEEISEFCRSNNIILIEDCSHSFGLRVNQKHVGLFGDVGVFSMQQRKPISTGDGCALITKHKSVADRVNRLRSFGDTDLSYNYRMSEFSAALAQVGLQRLENDNYKRRKNVDAFCHALPDESVLKPVVYQSNKAKAVYYSLLIDTKPLGRDDVDVKIRRANETGIPVKRTWQPLNEHPHFNPYATPARGAPWLSPFNSSASVDTPYKDNQLPVSQDYQIERLLELELHPLISESQAAAAASILVDIFGRSDK